MEKIINMEKELTEMTLEELWTLFPIFLVPHDKKWEDNYKEIESVLKEILQEYSIKRISHIGSTSIKNIYAKDIVDVLIEIDSNEDIEKTAQQIEKNDFYRMCTENQRISLNKGYTKKGFAKKVYHIHLRYIGDNDELYFRDYMNDHPDIAKDYEALKLSLWKKYEHNRDAYTNAKTSFIKKWTTVAKEEYGERY